MTKLKNSKLGLWAVVIVAVALYFIISTIVKAPEQGVKEYVDEIEICTESATRMKGSNLYTCIEGEWIYTGQNDNNKG